MECIILEYFWFVLCSEVCPLSECPLSEVSLYIDAKSFHSITCRVSSLGVSDVGAEGRTLETTVLHQDMCAVHAHRDKLHTVRLPLI